MALLSVVVEGNDDEAVAKRLCTLTGHDVLATYVMRGKGNLDKRLAAYNAAARFAWWFVLRDLNAAPCAPTLRSKLIPNQADHMCLRIPVRAVESWLLADRQGMAAYLSVGASHVPKHPEFLDHPKRDLVNLARRSRNRRLREEMVPPSGVSTAVGPGYTGRLIEFAEHKWDPEKAAISSESLRKCIEALQQLSS